MAQVDVIRPVSTRKNGGSAVVPSGTRHGVTSDNSDATYIQFPAINIENNWSVRLGSHTPPANHQRHRLRGRFRIRADAGTMTEFIDVGRGELDWIEFGHDTATSSFAEIASAWFDDPAYGLATAGALADLNIGGGWPENATGGATELRTSEAYIDIDCRARPSYSPEVQDAAGNDQSGGTVTDTNQPTLFFGGINYDGLPALDWEVSISPGPFVVSGVGTPPTQVPVTIGMDDGSYVATFTVRSTIRGSDPFEHQQSISFDVANEAPPPSPPVLNVEEQFGGYRVDWSDPGGQPWDNDFVVAELWRDDCEGSHRVAVVQDGLNGSYLDLAIPQLDPQHFQVQGVCEVHEGECNITYRVRYWGFVSTLVELPETIPADLILAWPDTVGTIPSGWTRVTALDDRFPRGASASGAPSATGGATSHSHTTPGHTHSIGSHNHDLDGNTGTSNSSTTSARFNGASQSQADQPHSHARPNSVGTRDGETSGSENPSTSSANNIPPQRTVIWIESDGSQTQYPVGVLGFSTEAVSGWTDDLSSVGRYLRGAPAAGNGGANSGSATHTHTVNSHTHTGFNHSHSIGNTGLSNPVGTDAGTGSSTPRWLPRHTHPMSVVSASTGSLNSTSGGTTGSATLEPPNRRLRVLRNTGGGVQTRIIGLYMGDIASLDPLLVRCDGTNGTPDMRTFFARDRGSDSVSSTGGASSHTHSTPNHTHSMPNHTHDTNVGESNTGSFEAPSFGDLGSSPTTSHTHSSGSTDSDGPNAGSRTSGTTNSVSHLPPYREAHFVRLDGTISGGPLPVPELRVTDFASMTVPAFLYNDGLDRLATTTEKIAVATDRTHTFPRTVADSTPLEGGLHTVSTQLAGEDLVLTIAVEGKPAIDTLERVLSAELVYYSPVGGHPSWYAPSDWRVTAPTPGVKLLQVSMVKQPWPTTPDPETLL